MQHWPVQELLEGQLHGDGAGTGVACADDAKAARGVRWDGRGATHCVGSLLAMPGTCVAVCSASVVMSGSRATNQLTNLLGEDRPDDVTVGVTAYGATARPGSDCKRA